MSHFLRHLFTGSAVALVAPGPKLAAKSSHLCGEVGDLRLGALLRGLHLGDLVDEPGRGRRGDQADQCDACGPSGIDANGLPS